MQSILHYIPRKITPKPTHTRSHTWLYTYCVQSQFIYVVFISTAIHNFMFPLHKLPIQPTTKSKRKRKKRKTKPVKHTAQMPGAQAAPNRLRNSSCRQSWWMGKETGNLKPQLDPHKSETLVPVSTECTQVPFGVLAGARSVRQEWNLVA